MAGFGLTDVPPVLDTLDGPVGSLQATGLLHEELTFAGSQGKVQALQVLVVIDRGIVLELRLAIPRGSHHLGRDGLHEASQG